VAATSWAVILSAACSRDIEPYASPAITTDATFYAAPTHLDISNACWNIVVQRDLARAPLLVFLPPIHRVFRNVIKLICFTSVKLRYCELRKRRKRRPSIFYKRTKTAKNYSRCTNRVPGQMIRRR